MTASRIRRFSFLLLALVTAFLSSGDQASAALLQKPPNNLGLVGRWSFDEGTGSEASDSSGSQNNMSNFYNSPTWVGGKMGKALGLSGANDLAYGNVSGSINTLSNSFTVSLWVKLGSVSQTNKYVFGKLNNAANNNMFAIIYGYNSQKYEFFCGSGCGGGYPTLDTKISVTDTDWHNITYTYDGTTLNGYLDGQNVVSRTVSFSLTASTNQVVFGDFNTGNCCNIDASIDETRVYSRALSATEVASLYAAGATSVEKTPSRNGLVAHWAFGEGSGITAKDSSGSGNSGALANGPVWGAGKMGGGLTFDGVDDYVTVSDSDSLDLPGDFTVTLWAKRSSGVVDFILSKKSTAYTQFDGWMFYASSGTYLDFIGRNGAYIRSSYTYDNNWHFYVIKSSSGSVKTYQDMALKSSGSFYVDAGTDPLEIGKRSDLGTHSAGTMDEIRIYNRALSDDELQNIYAATAPGFRVINASRNVTGSSLDSGLVGLWSFDGADVSGTTAYDRSGSGNNGTLTNGPTPTIGKAGQGMSFDGVNDYAALPNGIASNLSGGKFTLSAWVYPTSASGLNSILKNWGSSNVGAFHFDLTGQKASIYVAQSNSTLIGPSQSASAVPLNEWSHVVAVADGSYIKVYVNGVQSGTPVSYNGTLLTSNQYTNIGAKPGDAGGADGAIPAYFSGKIDEARVYNRALSADEVKALYNLGK